LVTTLLEFSDELFGEQALATTDDLSQLDVGGTEFFNCDSQPARQVCS